MKKRLVIFLVVLFVCFGVNIAMVAKNAVYYDEERIEALATQYKKTVAYFYPRGTIYDRNGIRLSNRVRQQSGFLDVPDSSGSVVGYYLIGAVKVDKTNTTSSGAEGGNGLQKAYDDLLSGGSPIKVTAPVDAIGGVITNTGYEVTGDHPNEGCTIVTTIDYHIQKTYEEEIAKTAAQKGYKGIAAVLSDADTGEILAMVSYGDSMNKAVLSYQPGSLMKIITAAAALEAGVIAPEEKYTCTGSVTVDGKERYCAARSGHGEITFEEAFAKSCNCYFYEVAKRLETIENGRRENALTELAKELGFNEYGSPMTRFPLEYEEHYSFVSSDIFNDTGVFNAALGQGNTQASPYLINKIVALIASGGTVNDLSIVKKITDPAGNEIIEEKGSSAPNILSRTTIETLQKMMKQTAISGTASNNTLRKYGGLAGKTGTAQNASNAEHSWFTGYFPASKPKYVMTVFIEEGGSSKNALSVFDSLVHSLYDIYPN